jgi:hypothetical protein
MVVWSAADGFEAGKHGVFTIYLLDCDASGTVCTRLGSRAATMESGAGGTWVESAVDFSEMDHTFEPGRSLAVRIVVTSASDTDMMFAYGYAAHRSRLTIHSERPAVVGGAPTASLSLPSPAQFGAEPPIAAAPAPVGDLPEPAAEVPVTSIWPWLITLALSTAALVGVGSVLMSTLTTPGRHQRVGAGGPGEPAQSSRISVSAP